MKTFFLYCVFFLLSSQAVAKTALLKAPKTALKAINSSDTFTGDVSRHSKTVIQFWASWCTGCATVMAQMTEHLKGRTDVGYITISLDETDELAMKYFANKPDDTKIVSKKSFLDPSGQNFSEINGVSSLPYLLVVDHKGTVLKKISGHPSKDDINFIVGKDKNL